MKHEELKEVLRLHKLWIDGEAGGVRADLSKADLRGADLRYAILRGAILRGADLSNADLRYAILRGAILRYAILRGAILRGADLRYAILRGAILRGADLRYAILRGAILRGADLSNADLRYAILRGAILRGADLRCFGDMKHIKTMQIDTWGVGYTHDMLQIGCQKHLIEKWRQWNTEAGRKWITGMDQGALAWADKHLALVLALIDASPADPT